MQMLHDFDVSAEYWSHSNAAAEGVAMETGRQHKLTTVNLRLSLLFSLHSGEFSP